MTYNRICRYDNDTLAVIFVGGGGDGEFVVLGCSWVVVGIGCIALRVSQDFCDPLHGGHSSKKLGHGELGLKMFKMTTDQKHKQI